MKGLGSLFGLTVLAAAVPAQTERLAATYVGKKDSPNPTRVTFEKDGTCRWETWKVVGKARYTVNGNLIAITVASVRNKRSSKLYGIAKWQ